MSTKFGVSLTMRSKEQGQRRKDSAIKISAIGLDIMGMSLTCDDTDQLLRYSYLASARTIYIALRYICNAHRKSGQRYNVTAVAMMNPVARSALFADDSLQALMRRPTIL